jgi:hypothetical protein
MLVAKSLPEQGQSFRDHGDEFTFLIGLWVGKQCNPACHIEGGCMSTKLSTRRCRVAQKRSRLGVDLPQRLGPGLSSIDCVQGT